MRTICCSGCLGGCLGGGVVCQLRVPAMGSSACYGGGYLPEGVSPGRGGVAACQGVSARPPPFEQNARHM